MGRDVAVPRVDDGEPGLRLVPRRQSHREKNQTAITEYRWLIELAASPMVHEMGSHLRDLLSTPDELGGRPRTQPYWAMALFFCSIPVFKSVSRTARNLRDPGLWAQVVAAAAPFMQDDEIPAPPVGPSRDHYQYVAKRLDALGDEVNEKFEELAADLFTRIHASVTSESGRRSNKPLRHTTLGMDGKVMESPQAHNVTERVDKRTGEVRPARLDPARGSWHEGGGKEVTIGNKFTFISGRLEFLQNSRIILGLDLLEPHGPGEAESFADLAKRTCARLPFINTAVVDGAMRGNAISDIQTHTGIAVVCPPRRKDRQHGGYPYGGTYYAGKRVPESAARQRAFAACSGHDLHAFAGALFEQRIASDGTATYQLLDRGQQKRERRSDGTWYFSAIHRLHCQETGQTHSWWESMTPIADDRAVKFNRNEYLRSHPITEPEHKTIYSYRSDTESFHAQLEQTFHKRRLPAWGAPRQRLVMIFTALSYNVWAEHAWRTEIQRQAHHPPTAA